MVLTHDNYMVRSNAVKNIRDDEFLFEIANYDRSIRASAVSSIRNQKILNHIIDNERFDSLATANAIKNIADAEKLLYCALKYDEKIRLAAIENPHLKDEEVLIDFAKYDDSPEVRVAALKRLNSQELFIDAAFHDSNGKVTRYAASQLNSKNALRELIKNYYGLGRQRFEEISKMSRYKQMQLIRNER